MKTKSQPVGVGARQRRPGFALLALTVALVLAPGARAQMAQAAQEAPPLGILVGPGINVEHDSNFLRSAGTSAGDVPIVSDTFYDAFLAGSLYETYGRQTVSGALNVGRVVFDREKQYDYTQEDMRAKLESEFPYNIRTSIGADHATSLAHFADIGTAVRDVIDRNEFDASLYFPFDIDWQGLVLGTFNNTINSAPVLQPDDVQTKELDVGLRFVPSSGNHVDLLLRNTLGRYPDGSPSLLVSPQYRERGADLRVDWTFSGASQLIGRAGFLERRNDDLLVTEVLPGGPRDRFLPIVQTLDINRNFAGPSYDLTYNWRLTGAVRLSVFGIRTTGAAGDYDYLSAVTTTFRVTPTYQPNEKIGMDAYGEWNRRDYFDNYALLTQSVAGTLRLDYARNAGFDFKWTPRRWLTVNLTARREKRDSNIALYNYIDNIATLTVQASF
jgi:hypothetical protein